MRRRPEYAPEFHAASETDPGVISATRNASSDPGFRQEMLSSVETVKSQIVGHSRTPEFALCRI